MEAHLLAGPPAVALPWSRRCGSVQASTAWCTTATVVCNVSIRYTERLAEAGMEPSVGSVGDSYDNALAESVIGLYKTEVIRSAPCATSPL